MPYVNLPAPMPNIAASTPTKRPLPSDAAFSYVPTDFDRPTDWSSQNEPVLGDDADWVELRQTRLRRKCHIRRISVPLAARRDSQPSPITLQLEDGWFPEDNVVYLAREPDSILVKNSPRSVLENVRTPQTHMEACRHHASASHGPSSSLHIDYDTLATPATPLLIILPDVNQPHESTPPPSELPIRADIRPTWFGDIVGRTLSLSRGKHPWVPTGDVTIKAGPVSAGGHSDIYLGELRRDGVPTQVALKQLRVFTNASKDMKKMFCREVQFWSRLRHPNVLPFWGCYELDEYRLFMVSPWAVNGNSLQYVKKYPEVDRRRILRQTAEALIYLHSVQDGDALVHGDLKADNVLISEGGDALLTDFGLTRYVERLASVSVTPSGLSPHGHIRFSAPELLSPFSGEDPRPTPESDVFAFGGFLIQLYSEEMPFENIKRDVQVLNEIVRGNTPSRPMGAARQRGLDDGLWTLAKECWRFLAVLRPSMRQVAERLQ